MSEAPPANDQQASFDGQLPDVRGYCGVGLVDPQFDVNVGSIVRSARCFGADFAFTTSETGIAHSTAVGHEGHLPVFDDVAVSDVTPPNAEVVAIEYTEESTPLERFEHPERAVYVAGSEDTGVPNDVVHEADHVVHVHSAYCENVATAVAIVLHDRLAASTSHKIPFTEIVGEGT